jgi:4-amino-4-deoxy-L-arabinose transferase-like glycosyltransferase
LPALGGALLLGALPRIAKYSRARDGLLMGLGAVILANTRPYEGFVLAIPVAVTMLLWLVKPQPGKGSRLKIVSSVLAVLVIGAFSSGYYYWRVTGSPLVMTYQVDRATNSAAPYFLWQTPRSEPDYHHVVMRDFYQLELRDFEENRTLIGFFHRTGIKLRSVWHFYFGLIFSLPLLFLPWALRDRRIQFPLIAGLVLLLAFSVQTWPLPHYVSPGTAIIYIVIIQCMRHLWVWRRTKMVGAAIVRFIPLVACAMIMLRIGAVAAGIQLEPKWPRGNLARSQIIHRLQATAGADLVFVRYASNHSIQFEWVYNDADIDHAPVIWARDMGERANQELLQYYPARRAWLLQVADSSTNLSSYSGSIVKQNP